MVHDFQQHPGNAIQQLLLYVIYILLFIISFHLLLSISSFPTNSTNSYHIGVVNLEHHSSWPNEFPSVLVFVNKQKRDNLKR